MASGRAQDAWVRVADSLGKKDRLHVQVQGRYVSILRGRDGALYCLDSICYHTGGPLTIGDIEDINGELCVKCPWHDYPVRLRDGAKPYQSMKFDPVTRKLTPDGWKYTQNSQRSHKVVDRGDEGLWVCLSTLGKYESDQFAYNASAAKNVWISGDSSFRPDGKSQQTSHGYKRSGEVLAEMRAGKAPGPVPPPPMMSTPHGMHASEWRPFRLISKKQMTQSMWLFRFALPEGKTLGWKEVERHVCVRIPGETLQREYTPVSPLGRPGSFDLAIKIYEEGALTSKLTKMAPGQILEMTGPHGDCTISWHSRTFTRAGEARKTFDRLIFLVAGSGVTPCIQILQDWVAQGHRCSSIHIDVIYANRTENEIAFQSELSELAKMFPNVSLCLAVSQPSDTWQGHHGRLDVKILKQHFDRAKPETTEVLVCGPAAFNETMRLHLNSIGFHEAIYL